MTDPQAPAETRETDEATEFIHDWHIEATWSDGRGKGYCVTCGPSDYPSWPCPSRIVTAALTATRRALADVTRERDFALVCSGCGAPRLSAILACVRGQAACCPDCSTLTMDERNTIRGAVSALALDLATSRAALEDVRRGNAVLREALDEALGFLPANAPDACGECAHSSCERRRIELDVVRRQINNALAQEAGDAK